MFFIGLFSYSQLMFIDFQSWKLERKKVSEDRTETNLYLVNLRRVIYLTIMNALNYRDEEAVHIKLLKIELQEGQEVRTFFLFCCVDKKLIGPI
jgi:pre-mRNA-splicing factor CWC22